MAFTSDQIRGVATTSASHGQWVRRFAPPTFDLGRVVGFPVWLPGAMAWRITGILFLIGVEAILYGFTYPFFSLALEKFGLSNWLIGLNASLAGVGILIIGPFLPRLIRLLGLRELVASLFLISLLSFSAILATDSISVWFLARFVMGACFAALWSTTEIWLNGTVDNRHRGRIIGASGTLYAGAQFLGPLTLSATGVTGVLPLIAAMLPLGVAVVVALSIRPPARQAEKTDPGKPEGLRLAFTLAGSLIIMSFLAGVLETSMQSLLPLFGLAHGLTDAGASQIVAVFSLGEAVLVALLGYMADRHGREKTLKFCAIPAMVVMIALPASIIQVSVLWPVLFIAGGVISGVYTLGIIQIGQDFRGQRLIVVSTGFAMAYAAGAVVGSTPLGLAIDLFGANALPVLVSVGFLALAIAIFMHARKDANAINDVAAVNSPTLSDIDVPLSEVFRPQPIAVAVERQLEPAGGSHRPEDDLEEKFRERSAEIAETVSARAKRREGGQGPAAPRGTPKRRTSTLGRAA